MSTIRSVGIAGTGHYVPDRILSNADLEKMVDTTDEWIYTRTGMRERRIAAEGQACSDLCVIAAERALEDAGVHAEELDLIIVATVTPDMPLPATACLVQNRIGARRAAAFDLVNACSGFVTAASVARSMIAVGSMEKALVIGAEVLSSIVDYEDRSSCILFGDGAGAVVLQAGQEQGVILDDAHGSDGSQWDAIHTPAGGSRLPTSGATVEAKQHYMRVQGRDVFKFAVSKFRGLIKESLDRNDFELTDLKLVIPHQVNLRIIEAAVKKLDIDLDRVYVNLDRFGNTSAASVPIALDEARKNSRFGPGDLVSLVAFGAGLSWGSILIRW